MINPYSFSLCQCCSPDSKDSHVTFWHFIGYKNGKRTYTGQPRRIRLDAKLDGEGWSEAMDLLEAA